MMLVHGFLFFFVWLTNWNVIGVNLDGLREGLRAGISAMTTIQS